jgi:hypothetical protein
MSKKQKRDLEQRRREQQEAEERFRQLQR